MSSHDQTLNDWAYRARANCRIAHLAPPNEISTDHGHRLEMGGALKFRHDRIANRLRRPHDAHFALEQVAVPVESAG
jgi:hypothetical protein